jgi:hypothetical protein
MPTHPTYLVPFHAVPNPIPSIDKIYHPGIVIILAGEQGLGEIGGVDVGERV